ncbi:GIY-YIG nuclease family protein [Polaribacter sp. Hel_I_88]|uniref:GIY-YIG nuclease family protein n=1 Tax=Polaribacter sp. Hel_I_88 TaxID=1250006 RepID=UPI00047D1A4A|nr:GIY-YIG nuclease family protein [Polaribacter sp. Hel_I_88]|tara:strand:+ start:936 stop:1184 length:249 start_codon:yes stop_codon:yes gene_type:complete
MFIVYILFSEKLNKYYIGFTSDLNARIIRHNQGGNSFTGKTNDWKIVYTEEFEEKTEAINREKQIKGWKSRKMVEKLISLKN